MQFKTACKKTAKATFVLVFSLFLLFALGAVLLPYAHALNTVASVLVAHHIVFSILRWIVIATAIYFYPAILQRVYGGKSGIDPALLKKYSQRRYPLLFFIVLELLIGQGGLAYLINLAVH